MTERNALETDQPQAWGIVEVMGHNSYGGVLEEVEQLGTKFLRVTLPDCDRHREFSVDLSASSIFRIRRCDEAIAKAHRSTLPNDVLKLKIGQPEPALLGFIDETPGYRGDIDSDYDDEDDDRPF